MSAQVISLYLPGPLLVCLLSKKGLASMAGVSRVGGQDNTRLVSRVRVRQRSSLGTSEELSILTPEPDNKSLAMTNVRHCVTENPP